MEEINLSIIIVTKDRKTELLDCLRSILESHDQGDIIVVDSSRVPLEELKDSRIRYSYLPKANMDEARNHGIKHTRNKIIAFLDDDGYVDSAWSSTLLEAYRENPEAGGVGGKVISVPKSLRPFGPLGGRITPWGMVYGDFETGEKVVECDHLFGANMSFRRDILLEIGGFDTNYDGTSLREETDTAVRIRRLGYKLCYQPKAIFYHSQSKRGRAITEKRSKAKSLVLNHTYFYFKNFISIHPILTFLLPLFFLDTSIMLLKNHQYYRDPLGFLCGWLGFFGGVRRAKPYIVRGLKDD